VHLTEATSVTDHVGRPFGDDPFARLPDQLHVVGPEPGLLAELPPHRGERSLASLETALGQLPLVWVVGPLEGQHLPVVATDDGDDTRPEVMTSHIGTLPMTPSRWAPAPLPRIAAPTPRVDAVAGVAVGERSLDVRLLGPITAERDGESVSLGGPRQRAVLARLALVAGQVVTVDRLVDDVWAGDPPATAVNTLQSYVSLLRRALGDAGLLRREGPGYVLTTGRATLDAFRFEDHVADARASLATDPGRALAHLAAGLAEWHGPVLADVADEDWARPAAVRWDELKLEALEARFDALLALGRHSEAVPELERTVDEHPLREGFSKRLMVALYRSGRQADALRAFSHTRAVLADELGLDPTPELSELQARILNHDPDLAAPASAWTPPAAAVERARAEQVAPAPPGGPSPVPLPGPAVRAAHGEFVGREDQLRRLHEAWQITSKGASHLVLLHGEAGAGKSRLAAAFAAEVHAVGAVVLWGRATAEAIVPFEPMVEAVRAVLRAVSGEARRRVAAERGLLALLLPDLEQLVPEATAVRPDPSVERYLLFETVADLLRSESAVHPMLVVIDDLQWADAPSLKMIEHVLRHEMPGRVLVVATVRVPSDDPTPELERMASGLARDGLLTRLAVDPLGTDMVVELLRLTGRPVARAADLHAATGGNAFFLTELIRHTDGSTDGELPESIRAMIGLRLDGLDPRVVQVLNLAVVAGNAAALPLLVDASGLDGDTLLDATDAAVAAGLLVEDGAGRLSVPHALVGQAIRARLGRTRRLDLHRRVAEAIEASSDRGSSPAMLAHHLLEAGSLVDRDTRIAAGLAAGQASVEVGAHEDAASWAARVEALVTDQVGPAERAELALLRGDVERARGDRSGAVAAVREAATWAGRTGDPMLLARAAEGWMTSLSGVGFDIGRPADPELVGLLERAIAELPVDHHRYQVRMRSMLTSVLLADPDGTRRTELADEAMAIAEASGEPELLASALLARRIAWWQLDRLEERTEVVLAAIRHAHRSGNVQLELTAMLFAMSDLLEEGRVVEHEAMLDEFERRAGEAHLRLYEVYAMFQRASHSLSAGDFATAQRLADEALAAGRRSHGVNAEVAYAGVWYRLALDRGELGSTLPESERMYAANPRLRMWQIAVVRALISVGRLDDARVHYEDIVGLDGVHMRDNQMFLPATCTLAEVAIAVDDPARAAVVRAALEPYADRIATSGLAGISIGPVSGYVGMAAEAAGDLEAAERFQRAAIARNVHDGTRPHEARARHSLARVLAARGEAEAAGAEAARAASIASELGMVLGA
jgi:DNA-binding SARP family transcriptional activator/tetratricopeptide (TPR) repeat protein